MTPVYALQFTPPLVLIGWMVSVPAHGRLGCVAQCFGSAGALAALALRGVWHGGSDISTNARVPLDGGPLPILFQSRFPVRGGRIERS